MPETEIANQPSNTRVKQESSLKHKAIRGTAWTLIGYGGSQVLRLGSNLILTRLLVPEVFGLMALVLTFRQGLTLFSDIGIRPSIVRSKRSEDPTFLNTAWTLQVIRGFWIWFGCAVIAWPVSRFYEDPRLLWLIPIVCISSIFQGFQSTALATLSRKMDIGKLTRFEFGVQIVSLTVMIVLAWLNRSIWAIVGGTMVGAFVRMAWSHRLIPEHSDRFVWDKESAKEIISFGKWIFVSTAMTFLAMQADRLILGKLFSFEMLGIYTVALTFADIPKQILQKLSAQVIFPLFSQQVDVPRALLRKKIIKKRWIILVAMTLGVTFLVCFGDLIVEILYDRRYNEAAWMLPILALGIWPVVVTGTIEKALYAFGKPVYSAFGYFLKFVYMLIALPLGFSSMGLLGAIVVVALNDIPFYVTVVYGLWREKLSVLYQDIQATALLFGLIAIVLICRYNFGFGLPIDGIL